MKALFSSIIAASLLVTACSQNVFAGKSIVASKNHVTKEVSTSSFSAITTTSSVDVEYVPSTSRSVTVYAPDNIIDLVEVTVSGKELKVGYKSNTSIIVNDNKVKVKVMAPGVNTFKTLSSGDIDIEGTINTAGNVTMTTCSSGDIEAKGVTCASLNASTNSSGDIEVENVKATTVKASTNSSGDIKLSGTCTSADFTTNSSGDIKAKSLRAANVNALTNSSGDIYCSGKNITAKENSSGDIHANRY